VKDQYFGDVCDYVKYGLLRRITQFGLHVFVAWMLTPADSRGDGRHIDYLQNPERFRRYDPKLFDALAEAVALGHRSVAVVEECRLVPGARFHSDALGDSLAHRHRYFDRVVETSDGSDLVFFDPDNGLEVPSVSIGRRGSSKYLYWHEVQRIFSLGSSQLIYQHFPRVDRERYLELVCGRVIERLGASPLALHTQRVAFLMIPSRTHEEQLHAAAKALAHEWAPIVSLYLRSPAGSTGAA
jgi:hypothetical protein